jgi:hypothetical protein
MTEATQTPNRPHVFTAIQQVKQELAVAGIGKNRQNSEQRFNFRGIDDILNALSTLTAQAQLAIFPVVEEREYVESVSSQGKRIQHVRLGVRFNFISLVDGSTFSCKIPSEASDYSDKATIKAISFALKYACITVFCIPVVGNEDGDFSSVGNEVDEQTSPSRGTGIPAAPTAPKAASEPKARAKAAAPVEQPPQGPNAVVVKLNTLAATDAKSASKVAELIYKAYKLKTVSDLDASDPRIPEILGRIDGYLTKKAAPAAVTPATANDIPE